jgi:hypothetical protein
MVDSLFIKEKKKLIYIKLYNDVYISAFNAENFMKIG